MSPPRIFIIIPVKNGIATIRQCLDAIFLQTLIDQTEVILIDSGSTDGTLEAVKQFPVRLYQIPSEEFNHGETRNYGVNLAQGEFIVMTVQDAIASDRQWLEKLIAPFDDPEVDAVCGGQMVPHDPEKNPVEWFRPFSVPRIEKVMFPDHSTFEKLSPEEKRESCSLDDVNSAYRRSALVARPFKKVDTGEDMLWARETYECGRAIVFNFNTRVAHYHHQTPEYRYRSVLINLYFEYLFFGLITKPGWPVNDLIVLGKKMIRYRVPISWLRYNLALIYNRHHALCDFYSALKKGEIEEFYKRNVPEVPQGEQKPG
jgi:rhamnosyltransferase